MCRLHGAVASSASSQIAFNGRCRLLRGFLASFLFGRDNGQLCN
jgi:hypothetical protein